MTPGVIRLAELFSGIGAQATALRLLGIPFESTISEIDKAALKGYNAIHGDTPNLGDIRNIDILPGFDILTYSFPCQDLSRAGLQQGFDKDSNTRSSLLWEVGRILSATERERGQNQLPKVLVMENVDAILNKHHFKNFNAWINYLSEMGYSSSYSIMNAKDYGVPQNRARCFMVSSLDKGFFRFPNKVVSDFCLNDVLESNPDSKYYLSQKSIDTHNRHALRHKDDGFGWSLANPFGNARCLTTKPDRHCSNFLKDPKGIRKLTPLEFWRLQGQPDENFKKAKAANLTDAQLYKLAGNSIAVPCMVEIFKGIIGNSWTNQRTLLNFNKEGYA